MVKAYSNYSDTYDKADELLTRFIMEKFPDCVIDNAIDVSAYNRTSEGIIESFMEYVKDIIKWLKGSRFDKKEYLLQCLDILPPASVEACKTKGDCDALLERLGLK